MSYVLLCAVSAVPACRFVHVWTMLLQSAVEGTVFDVEKEALGQYTAGDL